jgi:hypothetical protein
VVYFWRAPLLVWMWSRYGFHDMSWAVPQGFVIRWRLAHSQSTISGYFTLQHTSQDMGAPHLIRLFLYCCVDRYQNRTGDQEEVKWWALHDRYLLTFHLRQAHHGSKCYPWWLVRDP